MSEPAHAPLPCTPAPATLEAPRRPSAAHRPMRPQALAWDGDWREPGPPAAATAAHGCPAATGRPAAEPDRPPPGRWRHCYPASNRARSAPSRRCPPPPGRSTAAVPAGAIDRRAWTLPAVRWAPRSATMAELALAAALAGGGRRNGGLCRIASAIASACICTVPRLIGGGPISCCHLGRRLQIPAMRAKADSAAASDAMRRQAIHCWQSRSGLNEVSVITTPATRARGRVQSSYSGQAPLEYAPIRPSCGAEGRGRASPFLHCTDPRRSMPLPSSRPG